MSGSPTILTERLMLRAFSLADAAEVARLAGEREIAEMTLRIPHPYTVADAEGWLATHAGAFERRESVVWAITLKQESGNGQLIGAIGLELGQAEHSRHRAELGFWIGKPYWGRGYTTEAGRAVLRYGFEVLDLQRIFAFYFVKNPASGRVQEKLGMRREGVLRGHIGKWGEVLDEVAMGILREDWDGTAAAASGRGGSGGGVQGQ